MSSTNANRAVQAELNETSDELTPPLRTNSNAEDDGNAPEQTVDRNSSERESAAEINKDKPQECNSSTDDEQPGPSNPTDTLPVSDSAQPQSSASEAQNPRKRKLDEQMVAESDLAQPQSNNQVEPQPEPAGVANRQTAQRVVTDDLEKRKLIQQQLLLFLHSHNCKRRMTEDPQWRCNLPHCRTMRDVLDHMANCSEGRTCQTLHCSATRQISGHWKYCTRADCPVCQPLRQAERNCFSSTEHSALVRDFTEATGLGWPIPFALRSLVRMKVIEAITPPSNNVVFASDPRMNNLDEYARVVEDRIYNSANSNAEYVRLLADRVCCVLREFVQRREERRERREELQAAIPPLGDRQRRLQK